MIQLEKKKTLKVQGKTFYSMGCYTNVISVKLFEFLLRIYFISKDTKHKTDSHMTSKQRPLLEKVAAGVHTGL